VVFKSVQRTFFKLALRKHSEEDSGLSIAQLGVSFLKILVSREQNQDNNIEYGREGADTMS
jgi:hypothetical protein